MQFKFGIEKSIWLHNFICIIIVTLQKLPSIHEIK